MTDDPLAGLTVRFVEDGAVKVEEVDRAVLASSPMWATVAFVSRERDPQGALGPPRVALRRYKKRGGKYVVDKTFTLTTATQAEALATALRGWLAGGTLGGVKANNDDDG